eukprot:11725207-Karenia_brevis.AAC.1
MEAALALEEGKESEVPASDEDAADPAGEFEEEEMDATEQEALRMSEQGDSGRGKLKTKIFPFAAPVSYYVRVLSKASMNRKTPTYA